MKKNYDKKVNKTTIHLFIGPLLWIFCILLLPQDIFPTTEMRAAIGTVAWMAYWWVSACIDYAITGLLPIALNALIAMSPMSDVLSNYASEIVILLLGASILTISWEMSGLDKRIAYKFLATIGSSLTAQISFWFFLSVALSSVLPNSVVCATITPIAVSMFRHVGIHDIKQSKVGSLILLTIAWGTGLGGLASPLGGAMNLVIVEHIEQYTGTEFMYVEWVIKFLPIMVILIISNLLFIFAIKPKGEKLEGSKIYFLAKFQALGKTGKSEWICLLLFLLAATLSFTRSFYAELFPGLKPAYLFIICGIISFFIKKPSGENLMVWHVVGKKIGWGLIFVYAGGLAAGTLINQSGAAKALGNLLSTSVIQNEFLLILLITVILSDLTSNTATAAVAMPIVFSLAIGMNLNPIPYVFAATIGVNLSYCLPTSIRAIPVGYGLSPGYMFKHGIKLTLIVIFLMSAFVWFLMNIWPFFSLVGTL